MMQSNGDAAPAAAITPPRCVVAHAWITRDIYAPLAREAARRGLHPDRLAADIVTIAIGNNMVGALFES